MVEINSNILLSWLVNIDASVGSSPVDGNGTNLIWRLYVDSPGDSARFYHNPEVAAIELNQTSLLCWQIRGLSFHQINKMCQFYKHLYIIT